ncbi:MAG: formate dehydrogenase accessory sulfurtransferase FdhD, partial [Planctomycetota bacterium]
MSPSPPEAVPTPVRVDDTPTTQPILKIEAGQPPRHTTDELAGEEPLEIRVRGQAVSVTMRTPHPDPHQRHQHDTELALGFLQGEGVIHSAADVSAVEPCGRPANTHGNIINVFLAPHCDFDSAKLTRHVFASSSCGLCGKASIEAVHHHFDPIESTAQISSHTLLSLPSKLRATQPTFDRTGGLHAAALFNARGDLLVVREDIGRHNAVDNALGHALIQGWPPLDHHVLLVSGRASFEIMQKALSAQIAVVAAVSAPSSLAVEFSHESQQTLVGFLRDGRMNVY